MVGKFVLVGILVMAGSLIACNSGNTGSHSRTEVVLSDSMIEMELENSLMAETSADTLKTGPFVNRVSIQKNDSDGGLERYELNMNLYDANIADGNGSFCYGVLVLYVKSPDGAEPVEVSRRIISKVYSIDENEAKVLMDNGNERPISFEATIGYNPEDNSYELKMDADPIYLDDLIENTLELQ